DEAVAGRLDQFSMMLRYARLDQVAFNPLDAAMRSFLVELHQATIGRDVADDDRGKPPRHRAVRRRLAGIPRSEVANFTHRGSSKNFQRGSVNYRGPGSFVVVRNDITSMNTDKVEPK